MSLLSGIKFIPKENRETHNVINDNNKNQSQVYNKRKNLDNHKKHKKDKSKKKYKYDDEVKRFSKLVTNYDSDQSNTTSSNDSILDLQAIVKKEEEKELNERRRIKKLNEKSILSNNGITIQLSNENNIEVKKFDPNHFRSLINSLKTSDNMNNYDNDSDNDSTTILKPTTIKANIEPTTNLSSNYIAQHMIEINQSTNKSNVLSMKEVNNNNTSLGYTSTLNPLLPIGITNQSAASLLRDRLKMNTKKAITTIISINDSTTELFDYNTNIIALDKDIITLQYKYNQQQVQNKQSLKTIQQQSKGNSTKKKHNSKATTDIDIELDIIALLSKEKASGVDEMDEIYTENILRLGERYTGDDFSGRVAVGNGHKSGMDEEADIDMKMFERRKEVNQDDVLQRQMKQAIKFQQQLKRAVETCPRCSESKLFKKELVISKSDNCMLRIKTDPDSLDIAHIEIIPISHVNSILSCDEETLLEIERFQNCLRRMYEVQGKSVLFIESAVHFHHRPHAHIDVIPIDKALEIEARMYFKEAFMSCDEEWAQHHKIIELTNKRPLTTAIPKHFQYLSCIWSSSSIVTSKSSNVATSTNRVGDDIVKIGIVHPIESESSIDKDFCLDVVAGMLQLDSIRIRRKMNKRSDHNSISNIHGQPLNKAMQQFKEQWSIYDWTQYILV